MLNLKKIFGYYKMAEQTYREEPEYEEPVFNAGNPADNRNIQLKQLQELEKLEKTKLNDLGKVRLIYDKLNGELNEIRKQIIEIKNQKSGGKRKSSKRKSSKRRLSKRLRTRK